MDKDIPAGQVADFSETDAQYINLSVEWHLICKHQRNLTEEERVALFGYLPSGADLDLTPLQRIKQIEERLATAEPDTVLLARELLSIAISIMTDRHRSDPNIATNQGPALEMVRNVARSLYWCNGKTRLRPSESLRRFSCPPLMGLGP